jgi:hypothetical protein
MTLSLLKNLLPKTDHEFWVSIYAMSTISILVLYAGTYLGLSRTHGDKYLPLIITSRNLLLSLFLIYFYNPFRATYNYGRALPIFATAAGVSLLLTIKKFDILNLVNFVLYGTILKKPNKSACKVENDNDEVQKAIQVSQKI